MSSDPSRGPVRVLIADGINNVVSTVQRLAAFSEEVDPCGMARDADSLIREARRLRPDVVLLNPEIWEGDGRSPADELREAAPEATVIIVSSGGAGAMTSPQLLRAIRHHAPRSGVAARSREPVPPLAARRPRQVPVGRAESFLVFGGKGGVGKSMVAANLAVALRLETNRRVALVDLDLQFGDAALMLGLEEPPQAMEALAHHGDLVSQEMLESVLVSGPVGVRALLAPSAPGLAELVTPSALRAILRELSRSQDLIVVDGPAHLDERTLEAIEAAEHIVLVTSYTVTAIKDTRIMLLLLRSLGIEDDRISVVLNQTRPTSRLARSEIEGRLHHRVRTQLPYEPRLVDEAIDRGVPLVASEPAADITRRLAQLAKFLARTAEQGDLPEPVTAVPLTPATHPYRRRFSLGRRERLAPPAVSG